jgi:hypothetical protein
VERQRRQFGNLYVFASRTCSGSSRPSGSGPLGLTQISVGTAVTLEPRRCYAIFAYLANPPGGNEGRLITGFLRSSGGQAIVNNQFVVVPGSANFTSQGGAIGYVVGCNLSSVPQNLPAGWQLGVKTLAVP